MNAQIIHQPGIQVRYDSIESSQSRLLKILFMKYGRARLIAKATNTVPASITNWWRKGRVPLDKAGKVAKLLKVPLHALNYEKASDLLSKKPSWDSVLKKCGLTAKEYQYVKKGKFP